jgi:hypothetical protein
MTKLDAVNYDTGELDEKVLEEEVKQPMYVAIVVGVILLFLAILCVVLNARQGTVDLSGIIGNLTGSLTSMIPQVPTI